MMSDHLKNLLRNLKKERLLSFSNIIVMTISFLFLGLFVSTVVLSQTVLKNLEQQAQVSIFFKDDFTEASILELKGKIEQDERVYSVSYISKEDAYSIFTEINKDEPILLESVTASILPASLEIKASKISDLGVLATSYDEIEGVEEVRYFEDVISSFKNFSTAVYIVGFVLVIIFFVISYSIVISTLKMTIDSKGSEFEIMKLVGATDSYVRTPLIYQGTFYGGVASFSAGLLLLIITLFVKQIKYMPKTLSIGFFSNLVVGPIIFASVLWVILVISGVVLGYLGSSSTVKKYLKY